MCGYSMGYLDTKHSCFILVCSDFPFYIVQAVPSDLIPAPLGQSVRAERRADRYHASTGSSVRSGTLRLGGGLASDNMGNHVLLTNQSCLAVSLTFHGMIDFELTGAWIGKRDSCLNNLPSVFSGSLEHVQQKTNWLWVKRVNGSRRLVISGIWGDPAVCWFFVYQYFAGYILLLTFLIHNTGGYIMLYSLLPLFLLLQHLQ